MKYYCPTCFDDYSEEIVEIEVFKSKKRSLYRCGDCDQVYEEDEVYTKKTIIEVLDEIILSLRAEQADARDEYLQTVANSNEEIAEIERQKRELK